VLLRAGDVVWAELDPVLGTEQAGRRPALVLTSEEYHRRSRRAFVCPITGSSREWTFHVPIPEGLSVRGAIMVDQARMVEREARLFGFIEKLSPATLAQVRARLAVLVGIGLHHGREGQ
jgi:mRNA interferase MazF